MLSPALNSRASSARLPAEQLYPVLPNANENRVKGGVTLRNYYFVQLVLQYKLPSVTGPEWRRLLQNDTSPNRRNRVQGKE